ncbi:F5/8 type C domain-containing protein [Cryptosporidium felis]|nr:F5/8 type C domain-containing protein [Cryptosporidium felis]
MRWETVSILSIFFHIFLGVTAKDGDSNFYFFKKAHSSSTFVGNSFNGEFDPSNALNMGNSEWRSANGLGQDQQVIYSAYISATAKAIGLKIVWSSSPRETQVQVSPDGINYEIVVPNRRATQNEKEFTEDFMFDHSRDIRAVKIQMKPKPNQYIGIRQLVALGSGSPLAMIISGITDERGDNCLQVIGGKVQDEFAQVDLDSCVYGISTGDGRELWRIGPNGQIISAASNPPKCLTVANGDFTGSSPLLIQDCEMAEQAEDGRSFWEFNENSQLQVKGTNACVNQVNKAGTGVGTTILELNGTASSTMDALHTIDAAVDGDVATYWVSGAFEGAGEHKVSINLSANTTYQLKNIRIDWEFPPFTYSVAAKVDGEMKEIVRVEGNPSNTTLNEINGVISDFVQIVMEKPHPRYGKYSNKYLYGIREVELSTNNLRSVVSFCRDAALSKDARDKYFLNYVEDFNSKASNMVKSAAKDILTRTRNLGVLNDRVNTLLPSIDECFTDKREYVTRLEDYISDAKQLKDGLGTVKNEISVGVGREPGDEPSFPAEDCFSITARNPNAISGFYWILPRCSPEPIRVWCDTKFGASYYIWNDGGSPGASTPVSSISDIRKFCSHVGMEPLVLRDASQISGIKTALGIMGFKLSEGSGIPLAADYGCLEGKCTGSYQDLRDGTVELSSLVLSLASPESTATTLFGNDAVGLGYSENYLSFFNLKNSNIVGIVCSTNVIPNQKQLNHVDIDCDTVAYKNPIFEGPINTNIIVQCPPGCGEYKGKVFGTDGVYSEKSSICRAGLHVGAISTNTGGMFNVALEGPKNSYEGSIKNEIESEKLSGIPTRSLRVSTISKECPIDVINKSSNEFYKLSSPTAVTQQVSQGRKFQTPLKVESNIKTDLWEKSENDPYINKILKKASQYIDESYGVDPGLSSATQEESKMAILEMRRKLKPAEMLTRSQSPKILDVVDNVDNIANELLKVTGVYRSITKELLDKLDDVEAIHSSQTGFQSFVLETQKMAFEQTFRVYDMPRTQRGPSDWGYTTTLINGRSKLLGQNSPITGSSEHSPRGTFALIKNRRFFDFTFTTEIYPPISGIFGVSFRVRDLSNYYLLEFNQEEERVRLLRLKEGITYVLETKSEFKLPQKQFSGIEISTQRDRVYVKADGLKIQVVDEGLLSGTVGFYSNGVVGGVYFDKVSIKAKSCKKFFMSPAPRSPRCSNYKQCYLSTFETSYDVVEKDNSNWKYVKEYKGRSNAMVVDTSEESKILLKNTHTCKDGYFSFDFNPPCTNGKVSGIFRYVDSNNFYQVVISNLSTTLFKKTQGKTNLLKKVMFKYSENEWNRILINFEGSTIYVYSTKYNGGTQEILKVTEKDSEIIHGRVGLSVKNCSHTAFDKVSLEPFRVDLNEDIQSSDSSKKADSIYKSCVLNIHILQREQHCETMFGANSQKATTCTNNYCTECCDYYTNMITDKSYYNSCKDSCSANNNSTEQSIKEYIKQLATCISGTGKAFDVCSETDQNCKVEVCDLCCKSTFEGLKDAREVVVKSCQTQCNHRFVKKQVH